MLLVSINSNCVQKRSLHIQVVDEITKEPIANANIRVIPKHFFVPNNGALSFLSPNDRSPILELFPKNSTHAITDLRGNASVLLNSLKPHMLTANATDYSNLKIEITMKNNLFIKKRFDNKIKTKPSLKVLDVLILNNYKIE